MSNHAALGGPLLTKPFKWMAALAALAAVLLLYRFFSGIGAVTNINDGYPWGIWVVVDVVIGTAFGCAGYIVALLVYIMNRGEYHPLVRPAVMASLFGYTLGGMAVMFDLGRYWNFWNMLWPGHMNFNSIMLEIALCVMAYITMLILEFSPAVLEQFGRHDLKAKLNKFLFVIIALGVLFPTMHQSSLGTVLIITGAKVSPLWQTQLLPLFFLLSAVLMGLALVPFESVLSSHGLKRPFETPILARLARVTTIVLGAFLVLRLLDLVMRGALGLAFAGDLKGNMFLLEFALYAAALVLMLNPAWRHSTQKHFLAAVTLLAAGILYRINAYLIGYDPGNGWHYFPAFSEIMITVGVFSFEVMLYLWFVKRLPVLHQAEHA
jgi:Ni/Fe-hydrogenase subunit HybB-like protein